MEFRTLLSPDGIARVVYVRSDSPALGTVLCRSFWMQEAEDIAAAHNSARETREALKAAGQGELFEVAE